MILDDLPIFSMLKDRLAYLSQRQQVIAQNVANSDTPGFTPMDLKPFSIPGHGGSLAMAPVSATLTSPMHIAPPGTVAGGASSQSVKPVQSPDSETNLNGNSVVLEEEMMKMTQARMDYDTAVGFYQQSLALIQSAIKRPSQ